MTAPTKLDIMKSMIPSLLQRNSASADSSSPSNDSTSQFGTVSGNTGLQSKVKKMSELTGKQLQAWITSEYSNMKAARSTVQKQWYINLSMYYGRQYTELLNSELSRIVTPQAPKGKVRQTVNLIRPMIRTEIARLVSQKPTATVIPATSSDSDMFAAQAGEQVWEFLQQRHNFQALMRRTAFWASMTGVGFIKTWWDPNYTDVNYNLAAPPGMEPEPAQGDVCFGVSTPFNVFVPDLLSEDIEDQPYVFEAYTKPVAWVKKFWGVDAAANVASRNELIEPTYLNIPSSNSAKPDSVLIIEAWVKPGGCELLPDGGMLTLVGDKVVQEPQPFYSHGEFPFAKVDHVMSGKFYADSVLVDINPLQKEYNRTRSHIVESKNRMARPQLLAALGSIDPTKVTSEPGLIILYKPGLPPPTPLVMQPLPSYVLEEQDRIKADMEDISGQHQVSRGQSPGSGVTAATAISFLQERDDSIMGTTYASVEAATEKVARQALSLVVDYWQLPRIVSTTGLDQSFDSFELKGSDIATGKNIRVEGGSALPTSKPARQALLMDLVKLGVISGDQMLDLLDIGGVQKLTERIRVDLRQAQRENLKMKRLNRDQIMSYMAQTKQAADAGDYGTTDPNTGMPLVRGDVPATYPPIVPVNNYDNHAVHIATHNNYRKSQEFEMQAPEVKDQFERHVKQHEVALQIQQQQQMMMGMPPGGQGQPQQGGQAPTSQDTSAPMPGQEQQTPAMAG